MAGNADAQDMSSLHLQPDKDGLKRLSPDDHRAMALWVAECAEHLLPLFEAERPDDPRPRHAIEMARAWVRGEIRVGQARQAALDAHAAARASSTPSAIAAARAAGHAAATAHVVTHCSGASYYATKAFADPAEVARELAWQANRLPDRLRHLLFS